MQSKHLKLAFSAGRTTGGRVFAGAIQHGTRYSGSDFAGYHAESGRPLKYADESQAYGGHDDATAGLSIAGLSIAGFKKQPWDAPINALAAHIQNVDNAVQQISGQIASLANPSQQQMEANMLMARRARAAANDQGVLVHDQTGPKRQLLFSIATPGPVPAAVGGVNGTAVASGAPQKPFQPHRMIVAGTQVPTTSPGGTQGLLLTALFVGSDLQLVNVPGGQSGVPVDFFAATAFDAKFKFDAAYPAIGITLNVANPTAAAATLFNATFVGDAIS
jgi:hypothetical protein